MGFMESAANFLLPKARFLAAAMQQLPLISGSGYQLPLVNGRMFKSTSIYGGSKLENNGETTLVLFTVKQYKTKLNQDFDKNSMIHSLNHDSWLRSWIMLTFLTHRLFEMFNRPTHLGRIPWLPESSAKTMVGQWSNGEQVVGLFQLLFHWIKVVKLPCFTPRYSDLYLG